MKLQILDSILSYTTDMKHFISSAPSSHYKVYKIPKRTLGFRIIAQPTPKLKSVQRKILDVLKPHIEHHIAAKAYIEHRGIKDNAEVHRESNFLLKLDLENFFNSLTPDMLFKALSEQDVEISISEQFQLQHLLFWNRSKKKTPNLVLSVGAPSSPFLSNIIMKKFDCKMYEYCNSIDVQYSRYADDLIFSTNKKNILFDFPAVVERLLADIYSGSLRLNNSKTVYSSKGHNRHVTGITLANNNKLSLGRVRKRYISSLVYKFSINKLSNTYDIDQLKGLIGFSSYIEPSFILRLENKYGSEIINKIKKYNSEAG